MRRSDPHGATTIVAAVRSSGLVYLAFAPEAEREALLSLITDADQPPHRQLREPTGIRPLLGVIGQDGYAFSPDAGRERSVSVPILIDGQVRAVLLMMYMSRVLKGPAIIKTFVPLLKALSCEFTQRAETARAWRQAETMPEPQRLAAH